MSETQLPEIILQKIQEGHIAYNSILVNNHFEYMFMDIDCSNLPEPRWNESASFEQVKPLLSKLPANNRPCLYYFEIVEPLKTDIILQAYKSFQANENLKHRASAVLKKNPPLETNTLYVGKIQKHIKGRVQVHLAYYNNGGTAGLQLACWASQIGLKLKLHVYSFEPNMYSFITPLELPFAQSKNPLIGKH